MSHSRRDTCAARRKAMMDDKKKRAMEGDTSDLAVNSEAPQQQQQPSQGSRKKRKQSKHAAMKNGEWERCLFRIIRKDRYCNMERVSGTMYCGHHVPADVQVTSKKAQHFKAELRRRVPCPVDSSHTVYEYDLEKHVKVCNKLKDADAVKLLPYYSENINSGTHSVADTITNVDGELRAKEMTGDLVGEGSNGADEKGAGKGDHSTSTAKQELGLIDKLAGINFAELVKRIHACYDACVGSIPLQKLHHSGCETLLADKASTGASQNVLRHIEQQASILGHMDRVDLLDPKAAFLELGAGRGMLSLAMAQSLPDSVYVLVDRAANRGKADHLIREGAAVNGDAQTRSVARIKMDIRHLNLCGVQELADKPIVGMSKHLCGVATDLSLRAMVNTAPIPTGLTRDAGRVSPLCKGIAVALCCHHVCQWEDYVNPEFIMKQGFQAHEFPLLTGMTSWATCAMQAEGDAVEAILGITKSERAIVGRNCKRILDAGRVEYLKNTGMQAELVHYCEVEDSVENCLLLAWQ